jgi:hypothetical protein
LVGGDARHPRQVFAVSLDRVLSAEPDAALKRRPGLRDVAREQVGEADYREDDHRAVPMVGSLCRSQRYLAEADRVGHAVLHYRLPGGV